MEDFADVALFCLALLIIAIGVTVGVLLAAWMRGLPPC